MRKPLSLFAIFIFAITVATVRAQDVRGDAATEKPAQETGSGDPTLVEQPRLPELNLGRPVGGKLTVWVSIEELGNLTKVEDIIGPGSYCSNSSDADIRAIRQAAHDAALTAKFRPRKDSHGWTELSRSIYFELPEKESAQKPVTGGILNEK
ncbi:MAG: hypothetical protein QUS14_13430, partial [Pyrinomonadaceae bacterium]|nr:hypothetical protein [Pyrinomonadaceae bacterium]